MLLGSSQQREREWRGTRNAYEILVGKAEGKTSLERLRRRWEDEIIMDINDIRMWGGFICLRVLSGKGLL
jgi:hypothetical protein